MNSNNQANKDLSLSCYSFEIKGETWELHPYKAVFWPSQKALILSDTHFGKISHFRKAGIAIPRGPIQDNWNRLTYLITYYNPDRIIYLGDLFHSDHNLEWEEFKVYVDTFPSIQQELVMGNHDILESEHYERLNMICHQELLIPPFLFTHHPLEESTWYNVHGHLHPGVQLKGKGKQSLRLPCFFFGDKKGILPAFGNFTGHINLSIKHNDQVFVIGDNTVIPI